MSGVARIEGEHEGLGYDLHLPDRRFGRQLLVHLHGGGWRGGHRRMGVVPESLARQGLAVLAADYTLTTKAPYPRNLEDVFSILRFVRERTEEWDVDPEQIFIGGASSGAHLTALATTKGLAEDRLAIRPAGVIGWYGPLDPVSRHLKLRYQAQHWPGSFWSTGTDRPREQKDLFPQFIGTDDFEQVTLAAALDADPRRHLGRIDAAELPPFLLFVGTRDSDELRYAQRTWHAALLDVGARAELLEVAGADHGDDDFATPATLGAAIGFVRGHSAAR